MTRNSYPEEIYTTETGATITSPKKRHMVEKAYRLGTLRSGTTRQDLDKAYEAGFERGKQHENNLTGWVNITAAINTGKNLIWEALDGLEAKCVHPEQGTLTHKLERNHKWSERSPIGWHHAAATAWAAALNHAWTGKNGWALYIKGDALLRKLTADQLDPGTCFAARHNKGKYTQSYSYAQLVKADGQKPMVVCYSRYLTDIFATIDPKEVEVIDIYGEGTFEKPKGDA